jgi:hypothetical protein
MEMHTKASKAVKLDRLIKKFSTQLAALKITLIEDMIKENVSSIEINSKEVVLCQRQNKDFGDAIAAAELEIKAEKKKLETLGKFTISSVTNFIKVC